MFLSFMNTISEAADILQNTSYFRPVNIAKFLRTAFYRTPPEAVVCRCSSKQVFLKVSQTSQESICVGVSF